MDLNALLDDVLSEIRNEDLASVVASEAGLPQTEAEAEMDTYLSEASVALQLVEPRLRPDDRVLEVGGGVSDSSPVCSIEPVST